MTETAASRYREKNREKYRAYTKQYRERNPEKIKEYRRKDAPNWAAMAATRRQEKPWAVMCDETRTRSRKNIIDFDLTYDYIKSIWPLDNKCPILGIDLQTGKGCGPKDSSPSIDRIDPSKGYVRGNVQVISQRANRIKNNATIEELKLLVEYMSKS